MKFHVTQIKQKLLNLKVAEAKEKEEEKESEASHRLRLGENCFHKLILPIVIDGKYALAVLGLEFMMVTAVIATNNSFTISKINLFNFQCNSVESFQSFCNYCCEFRIWCLTIA